MLSKKKTEGLTGDDEVGAVGRLGGLFRGALGLGLLGVGRAQGPGEDEQGQQREGCGAVGLHDLWFCRGLEKKKREKECPNGEKSEKTHFFLSRC